MLARTAVTLILVMLPTLSHAVPACENPTHPLPALGSCLEVVAKIGKEAKQYPYLYEWSHHPSGTFNEMKLPRTWIDGDSHYTYRCAVTVNTVEDHEADGDSFSFKDISTVAKRIVKACLLRERGIRPQVGSDLIGFFHRPRLVRVDLYSVRMEDGDRGHWPGLVGDGNGTALVDVG
ncbi:MAG: hypothetical protein Q9196_005333 [Gyalolechia fulgens]